MEMGLVRFFDKTIWHMHMARWEMGMMGHGNTVLGFGIWDAGVVKRETERKALPWLWLWLQPTASFNIVLRFPNLKLNCVFMFTVKYFEFEFLRCRSIAIARLLTSFKVHKLRTSSSSGFEIEPIMNLIFLILFEFDLLLQYSVFRSRSPFRPNANARYEVLAQVTMVFTK